ncbi:AbrB/MazE/SpoVT family DNA-binding domain-containing protein [Alicyclobacillus macrosporangiidus]|uniref:Looped-hinge helix DNA binding domain-containing protein, AbrB family n=1 Tax=Alicyclobacillus macrosporangiidus TaxID=392015 RepID=A0A1I7KDV1_9BACL|nr:AbrB/MazE/SpoVT family DNA-binding domain-containing protein [Alicyclobacillus macrosporangiidus]SFU95681.1 looped-hinge helix DNA binding domain-containing protein, AbrB family [Alicyclobacillus macrosporangiidus]
MIHISTITSKFQITIPLEIRQKEGLRVGDKVMFQYTDQGEILIRPLRKKSARELGGSLYQEGTPYIPIDEARKRTQEELGIRLSGKEEGQQ